MHRSNTSNTWYCPRCDTHVATKFGCYCNANAQTIVEAELAKTEPAQTKVDSVSNLDQAAQCYFNSVYGNEVWNAAIEAAAKVVNYELGTDEMNTYYVERKIRELLK